MRRIALILLLAAAPLAAQEAEEAPGRPLEDVLRDLFSDVEPALRQFRDAVRSLGEYHAPEMLPNGDIIIRRKTPLDPGAPPGEAPPAAEDDGAIDL